VAARREDAVSAEPVRRALTKRDRWLIDCYRLPTRCTIDGTYFPVLDDLNDNRILAPNELIAEVDRAYFRLSLQNEVEEWFAERGFDLTQPTISKEEFERHLAGNRAAVSKPATSADARADFVRRYFDSTKRPSMKECENKWAKEHGSSARELLRNDYRDEAKRRKINVKRGPQNFAK
jgi:hypothetical protein